MDSSISRRSLMVGCGALALGACAGGERLEGIPSSPDGTPSEVSWSDLEIGKAKIVAGDGGAFVVTRTGSGQSADDLVAFSAICTHQSCAVGVDRDTTLRCPCHGSEFDSLTGEVRIGPATLPLAKAQVTTDGDRISITNG
jgi:Rieske Fe-S protein